MSGIIPAGAGGVLRAPMRLGALAVPKRGGGGGNLALPEFVGFKLGDHDNFPNPPLSLSGIAWEPGDLAIYHNYRAGTTSPPGLIAGWDPVATNAVGTGGSSSEAMRIARRVLQDGDSTWPASDRTILYVYRGAVADGATAGDSRMGSNALSIPSTPLVGQVSRIALFIGGCSTRDPEKFGGGEPMSPAGYVIKRAPPEAVVGFGAGCEMGQGWDSDGEVADFPGLTFDWSAFSSSGTRRMMTMVEVMAG